MDQVQHIPRAAPQSVELDHRQRIAGLDELQEQLKLSSTAALAAGCCLGANLRAPRCDQTFRVTVRFKASGWLEMAWHLYQWGDQVEVLSPPELAALVEKHRRSDFAALP